MISSRHQRRLRRLSMFMLHAFVLLHFPAHAGKRDAISWLSWTALQTIPSPTFTIDNAHGAHQTVLSFRWQITPVSYSWSANEFVSPVSILKVNPVRRLAGSAELFMQPEVALEDFRNADLRRSSLGLGSRAFFPVDECGEYLSFSLGAKYLIRNSSAGANANTFAGEIGVYTMFGLIGMQLSIAADRMARYSFSIYLKYY